MLINKEESITQDKTSFKGPYSSRFFEMRMLLKTRKWIESQESSNKIDLFFTLKQCDSRFEGNEMI